jgi:hypothetical protein
MGGYGSSALREEATKVLWLPLHRHRHGDAAAAGGSRATAREACQ